MPTTLKRLREQIRDLLAPERFVGDLPLACCLHEQETLRWEIYQGRLLGPAQTRLERTFESWNIYTGSEEHPSQHPLLSLKLDHEREELHVVRGVRAFVQEAFDAGTGIIETRETISWVSELIATLSVNDDAFQRELESAIARSFTGTRLPLTPIEAPLPEFSLGRMWYRSHSPEPSRELEFDLRSQAVEVVAERWSGRQGEELLRTLRQLFLNVSLSPWTDLVDRVLTFLGHVGRLGTVTSAEVFDLESWLLRLAVRHLTAYDLITFHHRGANYPDALLIDAVLNDYLKRLERDIALCLGERGRLRRRALRQGYVVRRRYEEHPVPDLPTAPGERERVYDERVPRIPEEQILYPGKRRRRLFADDPLSAKLSDSARVVLRQAWDDLQISVEFLELGAAVFLDRPFGTGTGTVSVDRTPALASLAVSRTIALERLRLLADDLGESCTSFAEKHPSIAGISVDAIGGPVRPGTVSLADAARSAPDFVFRETMAGSVEQLGAYFDFRGAGVQLLFPCLLARAIHGPGLVLYDRDYRPVMEIAPRLERGHITRGGIDLPAAGLIAQIPNRGEVVIPLRGSSEASSL